MNICNVIVNIQKRLNEGQASKEEILMYQNFCRYNNIQLILQTFLSEQQWDEVQNDSDRPKEEGTSEGSTST